MSNGNGSFHCVVWCVHVVRGEITGRKTIDSLHFCLLLQADPRARESEVVAGHGTAGRYNPLFPVINPAADQRRHATATQGLERTNGFSIHPQIGLLARLASAQAVAAPFGPQLPLVPAQCGTALSQESWLLLD